MADFAKTPPYSSELMGVFQPLLGWRSRRVRRWAVRESASRYRSVMDAIRKSGVFEVSQDLEPWDLSRAAPATSGLGGAYLTKLAQEAQRRAGGDGLSASDWRDLLDERGRALVEESVTQIRRQRQNFEQRMQLEPRLAALEMDPIESEVREVMAHDALVRHLARTAPETLNELVLGSVQPWKDAIVHVDPFAGFSDQAAQAVLAPIGVLHTYRQYFFEFESFLGPPVGHIWLSPGGTVELVEVNTRKVTQELSVEQSLETLTRSEISTTNEDELTDAVKQENANDVKLGANASGGVSIGVAHGEASASFNLDSSRKQSSETTHKRTRQQSEKLSSEIRRNFKTTFRTATETTDTSSRRYVVQNTTSELVNYELRRKMRRVGVQLQHIGSQLCWVFFVDEPGRHLATANLVHVAQVQDVTVSVSAPDHPPALVAKDIEATVNYMFIDKGRAAEDTDEEFAGGTHSPDVGKDSFIQQIQEFTVPPPPSWALTNVRITGHQRADPGKNLPDISPLPLQILDATAGRFKIDLQKVNFHDQPYIPITLILTVSPTKTAIDQQQKTYDAAKKEYDAAKAQAQHASYIKAVRERIKLAGQVRPRRGDELREEERHVVYRRLIDALTANLSPQHPWVTSELLRRMFDTDAMLYFVAPDWWVPRAFARQGYAQAASGTGSQPFTVGESELVGWGGAADKLHQHYLVTEDSNPSPLGASLGWLLELDGDNHRNAFLNSPWVKAVLPVRPEREQETIDWLRNHHVEGSDGLDDKYAAQPGDPPAWDGESIATVLGHLVDQIVALHKSASTPDPASHVLPTETVFEHGFDPLDGGVRYDKAALKVFDQWTEILPTDQVVASEWKATP